MLELGLKTLISYLLGSVNGSLVLGRLRGVDIRQLGSGNAGGTNALRTQGKWFALGVMVIDIGKGYVPTWLLPGWALPGVPVDPVVSRAWLSFACAGATVVGHCYPVWFGFAGGKGAATAVGAFITVPTPTRHRSPSTSVASRIASSAPGVVIAISCMVTPPAANA